MEFCSITPKLKKIKKSILKKDLIFPKLEISSSNIKKFQEMEALKKKIRFISRNGIPKKLLIFWEMELFSPLQENFLYFKKQKP